MQNEKIIKKEEEEESKIIINKGDNSYLSICCFELNIGLAFTYLYVISSSAINIINRIIFHNYELYLVSIIDAMSLKNK